MLPAALRESKILPFQRRFVFLLYPGSRWKDQSMALSEKLPFILTQMVEGDTREDAVYFGLTV